MNDLILLVFMSPILVIIAIVAIWGERLKMKDRDEKRRDRIIRKNRIRDKELKWEFDNKVDKVIIRGKSRDQEIIDYVNEIVKEREGGESLN